MKKHIYLTSGFWIIIFLCRGQDISVSIDKGKIQLSENNKPHTIPFFLKFDESNFKNKIVTFYSTNNETKKIVSAVFGSSDLGKTTDGDKAIYKIQITRNSTIALKDDTTVLREGKFYFKINNSNFSLAIKITNENNEESSHNSTSTSFNNTTNYIPGFLLSDVFQLKKLKDRIHNVEDSAVIRGILRFYDIPDNSSLSLNAFLNNGLKGTFNPLDPILQKDEQNDGGVQSAIDNVFNSAISSAGGLDVTTIADGFAKFLVKRAKEELSIAFFRRFKDDIQKYPDLETVFPNTYNLLQSIDQEIYNYSNYIGNLREAFRSDLQTIDENLPGIITNHQIFFNQKNNFGLGLALRTGCYISSSLRDDMHPGDIINGYPISFFDNQPADASPSDKNVLFALKGSIQSIQLFSESLKESDSSKHTYWVGIDKIRQLINDKDALKIYLGLVLQVANSQYNKVAFSDTENIYDKLNNPVLVTAIDKDYTTYNAFKQYFLTFGNKVADINKLIKDYEKPTTDSLKIEQYAKYFKTVVQFMQYCVQVSNLPYINSINGLKHIAQNTKKYFDVAFEITDLTTAITRKKYAEAVNQLITIYNTVINKPVSELGTVNVSSSNLTKNQKVELSNKLISENAINPLNTTSSIMSQVSDIDPSIKSKDPNTSEAGTILSSITKYGAFMSNMISAQNSDEVESAIEAAALPVGSSIIKRQTAFNVALNAYPGFFYGHEAIKGIKDNLVFNSYGITAPIGVSISTSSKHGWSHSLFISVVDIGAVAAFRISNDTTAQVPSIQLKNIISPGLFYSLGIPKSPLSINIGAQVGPNLRKVTSMTNDYSNNLYVRYSLSFCVDIPILNFYAKPK